MKKAPKRQEIDFSVVIEKSDDGWYVGQIPEVPEVISQGKTIEELKENLLDALNLVMSTNRETTLQDNAGRKIIKRKLNPAL
ncbi:MAG: type II toxin-antitoxin system HicB family antitoxin [Bacteroidetes bacterium]|nr:type II toxin-antitoxin system HicB family antitoxin [Bacteroidota bacterium]